MKIFYFITAMLISVSTVSGQNYKLFNADSRMVFSEFPVADSSYSLSFDSVAVTGFDSVYMPYRIVEDEFVETENCEFWGGSSCRQQIKPIWSGHKIIADMTGRYRFFTNMGDTLSLDFGLEPGGTSVFYEDGTQQFQIISEGTDTMTVPGLVDSVKLFRILHTDLQGNTINSVLNNQLIITGKQFGLIRFFRIDLFPQLLQPIAVLGKTSPEAGLAKLTNEMIFDHQPGDEIQYHDFFNRPYGPPGENYDRYIKHIFLARSDTPELIIYTVARFTFEADSAIGVHDTIVLSYPRSEVLAGIPFDKPDTMAILQSRTLYINEYFGLSCWSYRVKPEHLVYCGADNCWGDYDTQGPPVEGELIRVVGLGVYLDSSYQFGAPPYGYSYAKRIIYFKKDGISNGNEVIVGIDRLPLNGKFEIYPNPAGDRLQIHCETTVDLNVCIFNMSGQLVKNATMKDSVNGIDIRDLLPGMYFVKIICENQMTIRKFIKQ